MDNQPLELTSMAVDEQELALDAIDLGGIDLLEEDIVPCTCCGDKCSC